jgi:ubiquinone/menaquinone biosynthesis C-methylase UbiE
LLRKTSILYSLACESISKGDHVKEKIKRNISSYCNYNKTFTMYDQLRQPNGLRKLLQIFQRTDIPIEKQKVLEGGFGTGTYIDHIRHYVKEIYGVEGSDEGFEQALQKIGNATNVYLQLGNILSLPFSNDSFHVYMVNQVLHHLDTEPGYPNLNVFLRESIRVLKPGGVLTINTSSKEQMNPHFGVYWNYKYIEKAVRAMQARFIPIDELISRMEKLQFADIKTTIPSGKIFQEQYYNYPYIALKPNFLKGDSVYCFLSQDEIEEANARIRAGLEDRSIYKEMKRAAERAAEIGEAVIISARKPS